MLSVRRQVKQLIEGVESSRLWRAVGRRWIIPRLILIAPREDSHALWRQIYPDFVSRERIDDTLAHLWLAATTRRVRGGLILSPFALGWLLHTMRVPRPFRGLGIGGWLLDAVLARTDEVDRTLWLQVLPDNFPALRLYQSRGFVEVDPPGALAREGYLIMRRRSSSGASKRPDTP